MSYLYGDLPPVSLIFPLSALPLPVEQLVDLLEYDGVHLFPPVNLLIFTI